MMNKKNATRRQFLSGFAKGAGATLAAPLALSSLSSLAQAEGNSKLKVVFVVIPDGFAVDPFGGYSNGLWYPNANGHDTSDFELNVMSKELAAYRKKSLYLSGTILSQGNGGHNGYHYVLRDSKGKNTSIDNILGQHLQGNNATLKRIYAGPHSTVGATWNISFDGNSMITPEINPYSLYDTVFKGVTGNEITTTVAVDDGTHVFDPVNRQLQAYRTKLSGTQKNKLDQHLGAIEQLNSDLKSTVPNNTEASCNPFNHAPTANMAITSAQYREEITDAHSSVLAGGLSCGTSRVATLQIGRSADPVAITSVSATRNPHDCAHRYGSVNEWRDSRLWFAKRCKFLLDELDRLPDPDVAGDSLLDHTLVVFTSEMADGAPEHMENVPITLIGGASGLLNTGSNGRYYDISSYGDRRHWRLGTVVDVQRVWSTIAQACGTSVPYEGNVDIIPGIFNHLA